MRAADLAAEMRAAAIAMELRDFAQLREMGITRLMAGIGRVRDVGDGLYEPEESPWGHWRWITPVWVQRTGGREDEVAERIGSLRKRPTLGLAGSNPALSANHTEPWPDTPESADPDTPACGALVDLVAWHEARPEHWLLRTGNASWLGCIEPQYLDSDPVPIWRSPLSWMRNGCTGLVPLCRDRSEAYSLLMHCSGGVRAEDRVHAAQLRHILEYPLPRPPVYVGE